MSIGSSKGTQPVSATSLPLPTGAAQDGADISAPTAMPAGGSGLRGWMSAIWTKLNGSLAVTGTFWQATQPVSASALPLPSGAATETTAAAINATLSAGTVQLAAGSAVGATPSTRAVQVSGSDYGGTPLSRAIKVDSSGLLYVANFPASQAVTGTFWQATQPVSLATNTPTLQAGAAIIGKVGIDQTTPGTTNLVEVGGSLPAGSNTLGTVNIGTSSLALDATLTGGSQVSQQRAATLIVTATAAAAAVTASLPAVAGQFHYITRINIVKYAAVAVTGVAAPVVVTSTNLPGPVAWTTPTAMAIGTDYETDVEPASPIRSSTVNAATTIVCPATTSIIWRVTVYYYTAP